ncbi:hypothetical protein QUF64_08450 [Anaerolineales bacterium HSG6]|nr:hypothetical protein [Anaerolineales bacterium HSG6]
MKHRLWGICNCMRVLKTSREVMSLMLLSLLLILLMMLLSQPVLAQEEADDEAETDEVTYQEDDGPGAYNEIANGNFEFGFYGIPWIGFEAGDWSGVPVDWGWFKNNEAYGKYRIYDNREFGLICLDDLNQTESSKTSLSLHMQSTDDIEARLGVYQTLDVVPGLEYVFAISGTIQSQKGQGRIKRNNRVELFFDESGHEDWDQIPKDDWITLPWPEEELEYKVSGENDPDLATIYGYLTAIKPQTNRLTVFVSGYRELPNFRATRFTVDCISLIPVAQLDTFAYAEALSNFSATSVDYTLDADKLDELPAEIFAESAEIKTETITTQPTSVPAGPAYEIVSASVVGVVPPKADGDSTVQTSPSDTDSSTTIIIPDSGGVPDSSARTILVMIFASLVVIGLVGAGIWNIRREE